MARTCLVLALLTLCGNAAMAAHETPHFYATTPGGPCDVYLDADILRIANTHCVVDGEWFRFHLHTIYHARLTGCRDIAGIAHRSETDPPNPNAPGDPVPERQMAHFMPVTDDRALIALGSQKMRWVYPCMVR